MLSFSILVGILVFGGAILAWPRSFLERFSLDDDRSVPLSQLIPGTEDHFYYHCLFFQHRGELEKSEELLKKWIEQSGQSPRTEEIADRQALLDYSRSPQKSLSHIRNRLKLRFNHEQKPQKPRTNYPTSVDESLISREAFTFHSLKNRPDLGECEESALEFLIGNQTLNQDQRRKLLERIRRPDHPGLVSLVVEDLLRERGRGFGSLPIHSQLLPAQLDECLERIPELLNSTPFVNAYLSKMAPNPDTGIGKTDREKASYIDSLWKFVRTLSPAHNSLKANVLYHKLFLSRSMGEYPRDLFIEYLSLPRKTAYINRDFIQRPENRNLMADLTADFGKSCSLPSIGNDEPLVRDYLENLLGKKKGFDEFLPYIDSDYLRRVFAEARIQSGEGDLGQWYSMLSPEQVNALKERITLEFRPTNKSVFPSGETVSLELSVKNVPTLIIKLYRINTINLFKERCEEVTTALDLDGLVANEERLLKFDDPDFKRQTRNFDFPTIDKPGIYVIEFIGNGQSSRALIRKGSLDFTVRTTSAGHVFSIFDEVHTLLRDAEIWLSGHLYKPDDTGEITVPFTNSPGQARFIACHKGFGMIHQFFHLSEEYALQGGIHVDRESLLEGKTCQVLVNPELLVNNVPADIGLLEEVALSITSIDRDGITSTREVRDFRLHKDGESTFEFKVPEKVVRFVFTLSAKIERLSQGKKVPLTMTRSFELNEIDRTAKFQDLFLRKIDGKYVVEVRGKAGEVKPDLAVRISFWSRDFRRFIEIPLQTGNDGSILLGELKNIARVRAVDPEGTSKEWELLSDRRSYPSDIHGTVGKPVLVPILDHQGTPLSDLFSILETRNGVFVSDLAGHARIQDGYIVLDNLPPGDYDLWLKKEKASITIRISGGPETGAFAFSPARLLQMTGTPPSHIPDVRLNKDRTAITVRVRHSGPRTRVHIFATRFVPAFDPFFGLGIPCTEWLFRANLTPRENEYLSGRNIGDEYRYILERKYSRTFPGNMLKMPSLLLNPWNIRKTETDRKDAGEGDSWAGKAPSPCAEMGTLADLPSPPPPPADDRAFSNFDFLAEPAIVVANLKPDSNGAVSITLDRIGSRQHIIVVMEDPSGAVSREISLPSSVVGLSDLRQTRPLDPSRHFTERKNISLVTTSEPFCLTDITTSKMELYDSLSRAHGLLAALNPDTTFQEFAFILSWPDLELKKKRELYSKYACHELNFFLFRKDQAFFESVILPFIADKKDRTFLDSWLLGEDLSGFLQPWNFHRLNVVERILLSRRIKDRGDGIARHVRDLDDLNPPNLERFNHFFDTALKGSALETSDRLGLSEALKKAVPKPPACPTPAPAASAPRRGGLLSRLSSEDKSHPAPRQEFAAVSDLVAPFALGAGVSGDFPPIQDEDGTAKEKFRRRAVPQFFRQLDKTEEWVENNYYRLPIEKQTGALVTVNGFWREYALHPEGKPFLSSKLAEASRNFTEMMFALSVTDLPFKPGKHDVAYENARMTLRPGNGAIVFHKEVQDAPLPEKPQEILTSQNFFDLNDRYRHEGNERFDKFVTEEFQPGRVYGCQAVITNPTSGRRKVSALFQIPQGAVPVLSGFYTKSVDFQLEPFSTQTFEYFFYFPSPGTHSHFPIHVSQNGSLIGAAAPFVFRVVEEPTRFDRTSWDFVSQYAGNEEVLGFLNEANLDRLDLSLVAFRLREKGFFRKVISLLESRHRYDDTIWSFGLFHDEPHVIREFLKHSSFASRCGLFIESPILSIDPVARHQYQHREYWPLVNARAHPLGKEGTIRNGQLAKQFELFLGLLKYKPKLEEEDFLPVSYYMLLQERIQEALDFFGRVRAPKLTGTIQYKYLQAYLSLFRNEPEEALAIARGLVDHPVDRWRSCFLEIVSHVEESRGKIPGLSDPEDRSQVQTMRASREPGFDFKVENRIIRLNHQNLESCTINYYVMDIELLFSKNPFVQEVTGRFSIIHPNVSVVRKIPGGTGTAEIPLPEEFRDTNVMVEITAEGATKSQAYYAHSMDIQVAGNYGQVRVAKEGGREPVSRAYIKVYARMKDGAVRFYKDGYSDLRGRFDFASLSTNDLEQVEKFSILIMSEKNGAVIREADPPKT